MCVDRWPFQIQSIELSETSQEYSLKIRNILVVPSNGLQSSKLILGGTINPFLMMTKYMSVYKISP